VSFASELPRESAPRLVNVIPDEGGALGLVVQLLLKATGDPEREARAWAATLAEAERKREKYQEMYAADAMTLEESRSRLETLEESRESARRELAELASWHERLQALERDKELLLQSYTTRAPEALDSLGPEERRTVYSMLGLRVARQEP
jgi:flagellar biosynthesis GTPase FlhF